MGKNKIDPKKNIKKIFGKRISLKTDFLDKTDFVYFDIYRCVWKADETISVKMSYKTFLSQLLYQILNKEWL